MEVLKVTLKQHTPLIHFQHYEKGATLRASEVKPKLDKFILTKIGNGDYQNGYNKARTNGWLIREGENPALDYKISIKATGDRREYLVASYLSRRAKEELDRSNIKYIPATPYFAQEKENKNVCQHRNNAWNDIPKKGILYNGATIDIIGDKDIIELISIYIQAFFLVENFGTRQNKGFGCFSVNSIYKSDEKGNATRLSLADNIKLLKDNFDFCYISRVKYNADDLATIFNDISVTYKKIKSGINNPYVKSSLMEYFKDQDIRWEKKHFKMEVDETFADENGEAYILKDNHRRSGYDNNGEYKFVRALLGIPNQYEFLLENPPKEHSKLIIKVKGENGVDRFKSPLQFKVIDGNIFIAGNTISPEILDRHFNFYVNIQDDDGYHDEKITGLDTPAEFDLKRFIRFAMRNNPNFSEL